jgi:hypothetical protein
MSVNWTASCQITGISKEQKIEIVTTLKVYPLVLKDLDYYYELSNSLQKTIDLLKAQITEQNIFSDNLQLQVDLLSEQKKLYEEELRRKKSHLYLFANMPLNSINPEALLLYSFKEKLLLGAGLQYNNITKSADIKVGLGIKIF